MNILSLFDGMSCSQIALNNLGIKYDNYFASEVDKYAIKVTQANYPNTIQLGDARNIKASDLPKIDLLIGGSPCQGFSFAGKQLNFDDERSKLFFEYVRILREVKPKYFLLENVLMKKEYQDVISKELGVEPIMINSSLLSAQNRKRLYWTNIKEGYFDLFGNKISFIPQPGDKNLVLKDILEDGFVDTEKSYCLTASYFKGVNLRNYLEKKQRQLVFNSCQLVGLATDIKGNDSIKRVYSEYGKAPTLTAICGGNQEPKINTNSSKENSYRKLTVRECARLQTIPEWFNFPVSNSQAYKMIGNGFTVDIISHILSFIDL